MNRTKMPYEVIIPGILVGLLSVASVGFWVLYQQRGVPLSTKELSPGIYPVKGWLVHGKEGRVYALPKHDQYDEIVFLENRKEIIFVGGKDVGGFRAGLRTTYRLMNQQDRMVYDYIRAHKLETMNSSEGNFVVLKLKSGELVHYEFHNGVV